MNPRLLQLIESLPLEDEEIVHALSLVSKDQIFNCESCQVKKKCIQCYGKHIFHKQCVELVNSWVNGFPTLLPLSRRTRERLEYIGFRRGTYWNNEDPSKNEFIMEIDKEISIELTACLYEWNFQVRYRGYTCGQDILIRTDSLDKIIPILKGKIKKRHESFDEAVKNEILGSDFITKCLHEMNEVRKMYDVLLEKFGLKDEEVEIPKSQFQNTIEMTTYEEEGIYTKVVNKKNLLEVLE